jgi:hypothetical protein
VKAGADHAGRTGCRLRYSKVDPRSAERHWTVFYQTIAVKRRTVQDWQSVWGIQLDVTQAEAMRRSGAWHGRALTDFFDPHADGHPERTAIIASHGETGEVVRISYAELSSAANKITLGLHVLGIRRGSGLPGS